jgi:hypothetical protein
MDCASKQILHRPLLLNWARFLVRGYPPAFGLIGF